MVCTTLSLAVSTTETLSSKVLVTNRAPSATCSAVGCRPTGIEATAASGAAVSMTLRVPVVEEAVTGLAGTSVP